MTVVTAALSHTQEVVCDDQQVHVIRIPEMFIGRLRGEMEKNIPINYRGSAEKSILSSQVFKQLCAKCVRIGHYWTLRQIQWPDFAWTWIIPATNCVRKLLAENSYDVLISVSLPFSGHVVGAMANEAETQMDHGCGRSFLFYGENSVNNFVLYNKVNVAVERRYFQEADGISVTTSATRREYVKRFPEAVGKVHVIPPLLSGRITAGGVKESNGTNRRSRQMLFVGELYKDIRTPYRLINCFYKAQEKINEDVELHFVGGYEGLETFVEKIKDKSVIFHGRQHHDIAIKMMMESDWLVNIGNETSFQLPSKLVEYEDSGKPILNICSSAEDSSAKFLRDYPSAVSLYINTDVTEEHVSALARFLETAKPLDETVRTQWERRFSIEPISRSYETLFHDNCNARYLF